ncbi:hypothetical protein [[Mycobacterium] holstebronense]|uniref:Uncharacterized protein n=1 Tax=[Mycobacterium] holstebronense TaxID=3064288 RepID=A0ABM9LE81_9MYCO|nr:hypothetical protein [Mycolicibacter sp. MU0102]CAJ1497509.1 hypothetical protein MU0102_000484 [Mycolicibacter sp. MU0102]
MQMTRILTLAAIAVAGTLGLAAPASAELVDGSYELTYLRNPAQQPSILNVSSCGAGCKVGQIVGPYGATELHLQGDSWIAPGVDGGDQVVIDNNTLSGSANGNSFQLAKVG